jgi:peptidoglycan/xylan/chitin deacetylase (PgdA/CDA1 family)
MAAAEHVATCEIAFKVDVCNHRALHDGVPGIAKILDAAGVPAAFFVAFGPDHSGRALRRVLRRGFLTKMLRTRAPRMYGWRTLLYGTLLPAPSVGESAPDLLRALERAGHEVGLHGFDHVRWHDGLLCMRDGEIRECQARACALFDAALGHPPRFSGAPAWQVSEPSLQVQDELGLDWASDCRDGEPFYPEIAGRRLGTLQIPTTLPTSDEVLGAGSAKAGELAGWYSRRLDPRRLNVVGLHAEAEGLHFSSWFRDWLRELRAAGARFVQLSDVAVRERERAPCRRVVLRAIPGRADAVASPADAAASPS